MKKLTASLLSLLLVLITFLPAAAQEKPYIDKEFTLGSKAKLTVKSSSGHINVTGTGSKTAKVKIFVSSANGSKDQVSEEVISSYNFDVRQEGNEVFVTVDKKDNSRNNNKGIFIRFEVEVPQQTECKLTTAGGHVNMNNLQGVQSAMSSGGHISLKNIEGHVVVTTSGGNISVAEHNGHLVTTTSGGNISIEKSKGGVKATTAGGNINLKNIEGDVTASTNGGSITADVTKLGKTLTLMTLGGNINAIVPKGAGLDLDMSGSRVTAPLENFKGTSTSSRVHGALNGGGVSVKLQNNGGGTVLSYHK